MSGIMQALLASGAGATPGSFYFPSATSYITLNPGIIAGTTYHSPFTVEGWFFCTDAPGNLDGPVLISTTSSAITPGYARALSINVSSTTQIIVESNGGDATQFDLAQTIVAGTWYYVAVSRDTDGFIELWSGKLGDTVAVASTSGRFDCSVDTNAWALTGISDCVGRFIPGDRSSVGDYISGVRITTTNLYATTDATIPMPTETFGNTAGIEFLQSPTGIADLSGTQTLTSVNDAVYSTNGPAIIVQPYV